MKTATDSMNVSGLIQTQTPRSERSASPAAMAALGQRLPSARARRERAREVLGLLADGALAS